MDKPTIGHSYDRISNRKQIRGGGLDRQAQNRQAFCQRHGITLKSANRIQTRMANAVVPIQARGATDWLPKELMPQEGAGDPGEDAQPGEPNPPRTQEICAEPIAGASSAPDSASHARVRLMELLLSLFLPPL